jgi:formiminotetrahydrofolate cyclodeaminase
MGVELTSRNLAQVSMNLTDFEQTPVHRVFETVRSEAERYGVSVLGSEIVGLVPKKALEMTADFYLRCENFHPDLVLENRLAAALAGTGLGEFLDQLAAPTPAPGGGSAAAAAGAMAAALGGMVSTLAKLPGYEFEPDRRYLAEAVDRDAVAFREVVAAYKLPKNERAAFIEEAMQKAATVPMEVAECAHRLKEAIAALARDAPPRFASDVETASALAKAALTGAVANVRINLPAIKNEEFRREFDTRLAALQA